MTSPSHKPPETAKQFVLRVTALTVSVSLMLSEIPLLASLGLILLVATSVLSGSERRAATLIPVLLFMFAVSMAVTLLHEIAPAQGVSLALLYHPWYAFVMIGIWTVGMIWECWKWRSSKSDKQP